MKYYDYKYRNIELQRKVLIGKTETDSAKDNLLRIKEELMTKNSILEKELKDFKERTMQSENVIKFLVKIKFLFRNY